MPVSIGSAVSAFEKHKDDLRNAFGATLGAKSEEPKKLKELTDKMRRAIALSDDDASAVLKGMGIDPKEFDLEDL